MLKMPRRALAAFASGSNRSRLSKKVMRAPVLHGAAEAARHRDQVELGQRIFHAEIVVEVAQQVDRAVEREAALLALAGGGDHADRDAVGLRR